MLTQSNVEERSAETEFTPQEVESMSGDEREALRRACLKQGTEPKVDVVFRNRRNVRHIHVGFTAYLSRLKKLEERAASRQT